MVLSGTTVHVLGLVNPAHICHRPLTDWQVLLWTELHPSPPYHRMWPYMEMRSLQMILIQMTSSWSKVDSSSNKTKVLKRGPSPTDCENTVWRLEFCCYKSTSIKDSRACEVAGETWNRGSVAASEGTSSADIVTQLPKPSGSPLLWFKPPRLYLVLCFRPSITDNSRRRTKSRGRLEEGVHLRSTAWALCHFWLINSLLWTSKFSSVNVEIKIYLGKLL